MEQHSAGNGWRPPQPSGIKMRACSNCSRLKMKCRWPPASSPSEVPACTRCERLGIDCGVPNNLPRKKRGKSNRVAQLEQKLDGIMSLLESSQKSSQSTSNTTASSTQAANTSPLTPESQSNTPWMWRAGVQEPSQPAEPASNAGTASSTYLDHGTTGSIELVPGFKLTFAEANEYLNMYRREYMPMFPFVIVEENTKAHELYHNSPALFWSIMAAVAQTTENIDVAIKKWLREYVAERMVVKQERTLEILQAILIHLIWGSFHFYIDAETPLFINLAQNIVLDLKLDWPPESGQVQRQSLLGAAWCHMNKQHLMRKRKAHTPAEIRAVLGLHYACSITMSMFRRGPGMTWNSYLTKCSESMAALSQHPLDELMSASVRLQRIAQKGFSALPGVEYLWGPTTTVYGYAQEMTMTLTRDNMEKFAKSQTPEVQNNVMFRQLYHSLLVRLYEPVLSMQPAAPPTNTSANSTIMEPFRRTDMLWKLVDACRDLFDARKELTTAEATIRPSSMTGFLAFCVITSSRVLFHEAEDWNPAVARRHFDFGAAMLDLADQFERADEFAAGAGRRRQMVGDKTSMFTKYSQKMRWIKQWYDSRASSDAATAQALHGSMRCGPDAATAQESTEAGASSMVSPEEGVVPGAQLGDDSMTGVGMNSNEGQRPIECFLPGFQFDEAFWQEMLLCPPQPEFTGFSLSGNGY